ncbi:hypothetical protein NG895_10325 [Aeoliella sp. ICT_H6.2]|uniref:Uncharacterized protein n=1 Tax=Aeoliella straminimaris TaxID=2954799 RepID=A0A9X2FA12_9BACT|nr:hypothetical protein [Aeoliella straminimaris]MCO6044302.1 hypothetical protein [Aeoliella straminimaris]
MRSFKTVLTKPLLYVSIAIAILAVVKSSADRAHAQATGSSSNTNAEREAAWNSPEMLRARAWVTDQCKNNDAMSEAEAAQHMQAMMSMTPQQMKLFAMMHDSTTKSHPAVQVQQAHTQALQSSKQAAAAQQWWMNNVHKAEMQRALKADGATQQAYNNISSEETAAANQEQSQLRAEQQNATENQDAKMDELNSPALDSLNYPYGWGGYPGTHYHYHFYPGQ